MTASMTIRAEESGDNSAITSLQLEAFGPGAFARAAFRVREQAPHQLDRSFVGLIGEQLVASVRLTTIVAGVAPGLLLGPLVVAPQLKNRGLGRALLAHAVDRARTRPAGNRFILLVGDEPYYAPFGFTAADTSRVEMPGPVDPTRLLALPLVADGTIGICGLVRGVRVG